MISVMMPVYNAGTFLREAIDSVLKQTEEDLELVIVNDGSTDQSEEIILSYNDPRIVYIKQENGGEAAARNKALEHMKGEFIVFQDADDISLPMRLAVLKRNFTSPAVGFVHSDFLLINEQNKPIGYWASGNIDSARLRRYFLKTGTPFNNPGMMVRREALQGFRYDTSLYIGTDTDMVFHTTANWATIHVPLPLLLYRRHSASLSRSKDYRVLFAHVQKFLDSYSLPELVPELDWTGGDLLENQARATAMIALFLQRRGMIPDCRAWDEIALKSSAASSFVNAIGHMLTGDYTKASDILTACSPQDAVVLNYLGENYAYLGQIQKASEFFLKSLQINPFYEEPLDNLKALGWVTGLEYIDASWKKFSHLK